MKRIIITGCNGQLGREINRLYDGRRDIELINTDVEDLDITDINDVINLSKYDIFSFLFSLITFNIFVSKTLKIPTL